MSAGTCHHGNPANGTCRLCKDEYIDMTLYGKPPLPCPSCAQWEKEANEERVRWSNASLEWNELVTKLESRLSLAEKVVNEAKMAVIGYPRYEMRPLRDALAKLKEGETE